MGWPHADALRGPPSVATPAPLTSQRRAETTPAPRCSYHVAIIPTTPIRQRIADAPPANPEHTPLIYMANLKEVASLGGGYGLTL